jgi:hypothetical protein
MPNLQLLLLGTLVLSAPGPTGPGRIGGPAWSYGSEGPRVRLGLQHRPLPFPISLPSLPALPPWLDGGGGRGDPAGGPLRSLPQEVPAQQERSSFFDSEFAQLDFQLRGRGEFGGDWNRFTPCETGLQVSCDPGLFPQLRPDVQFGLQAGGTIANRIHVDVDYDETREFSAANNVNMYYEGRAGEVLQRVEVGDVTLRFPESRFLTQGIPAGNFGFRALAQAGPLDLQAVWAQQNGDISSREFELAGVGGRQAFVQEDTLVLDDADFVTGQFFFLLDPREITDFPHLDVLSLEPGSASPAVTPGAEPVQLYRFENDPVTRQQVEGYIQAEASAERDGVTVKESGWFRYLQPGVDYFLHPSGLWVALRRPLRGEEMLAVTFVTATGDTVGDYNPERLHNAGIRPSLRLLKASGPRHQPGSPTWEMEMHQVYRISGSDDVEASSVALSLSLGELSAGRTFKRRSTGEEITLLKLMGLDEEAPVDQVDPVFIYRPAQEFFQERPPVSGTFIVFPTLRPFAEPPSVPSLGLSAAETREILGSDANTVIYDSVDPVERENGGLFRLTIPFRIRTEGFISTFSLGALGIRDGSERIYFGDRLLRPGEDYVIDYDVGQVTLLSPEALFGSDPQGRILATWEQKPLFQIAPTAIFGFNARYGLGDRGAFHLLGLYQQERTLQKRPQLGMEPSSIFLGGLNGNLTLGASWLDNLAARVPGAGADSAATLSLTGEMALSLPNPNTQGDVYLDDFNSIDQLPLSLLDRDWHLGSIPEQEDGAEGIVPTAPAGEAAASLVWQHNWILQGPSGDSLGIFEGFFPKRDIDVQINIAGTETRQPGLRLTFGPEEVGGDAEPIWRSITSVLSNTGSDLSRTDFLEFYAAGGEDLVLVVDLGRVSEDALFVDQEGQLTGVDPGTGEPWGIGILDQEADPRKGEIWNNTLDRKGVWVEECLGERGRIYPLGDPRANCTAGNGRNDTEDLDGDGNLATEDRVYRYVVRLDGSSPYLSRTREETGSSFQLYRIPLRGALATNVGGRVTEADWRAVKHLRITVVGPNGRDALTLARMKLVGSRWLKRGQEGILSGWHGDVSGSGGQLEVGPVSSLTEGGRYQSPPGIRDELDDPTRAFGGQGVEFNESSLSLRVQDLAPGERAEIYSRFPQRPRDFLTYREARLWVVATEGDWGMSGAEFFLKVGSDPENFYLFRTDRPTPPSEAGVTPSDWLPEVLVDFTQWLILRRQAEEELIRSPPPPGGPPVEIWSADSTYAVFLKDRARAPNLAAVRELSLGVWNSTEGPVGGTVWINDLRLNRAVQDPGYAGFLDINLEAPSLFRASLSYSSQGPFFRQLTQEARYQDDNRLSLHSTLELGRVAPEEWGVSVPVLVTHARVGQDPTFLAQSDLRADKLRGLREPSATDTRVEVGFRKTTPVGNRILDPILAGLSLRAGYDRSRITTTTLEAEASGVDARVEYSKEVEAREVGIIPGFAEGIVRALLPGGMEDAALSARVRWSPERLRLGTLYTRRESEAYRFEQILVRPSDSLVIPTRSPREALETTASISFRPFDPLTGEMTFFSVRDLLPSSEAVLDPRLQPVLQRERWGLGPLDLGWETNRNLRTRIGFRPSLTSWLRTDFVLSTDYASDRSAALAERVPFGTDTLVLLQRNVGGNRNTRISVSLEPAALVPALGLGAASGPGVDTAGASGVQEEGEVQEGRSPGLLGRLMGALDAINVTRQGGLTARYYRRPIDPGPGFQLGWGGEDDFRFVDGDTASILTGRTLWTAGTGVRLPLNLRLSGNYSDSRTEILHLRSDRELRNRSWPDVRLNLTQVPLPRVVRTVLPSLSLVSGYRKNRVETTFGGLGLQRRVLEERQVPFEVSARWWGEVTSMYRGGFTDGEGRDPTGDTRNRRRSHTFTLSAAVGEPPLLADRLDGPLRMSVGYQYSSELQCRIPSGRSDCIPFVDYLSRSVSLALDTRIIPLDVGIHLNYTDRQSFIGRHEGSTQFQLGIFGQFVIDSRAPSAGAAAPGSG